MSYRISLKKENFKFSTSHFTIFGPAHAERLHGHNYYVSVELRLDAIDPSLGLAFDFNEVKPLIRDVTSTLDEYVLLPELSSFLKIERKQNSVIATFGHKRYEFPAEDVRILPMTNISSEELARYIAEELLKKIQLKTQLALVGILSVGVQETRGQSVTYEVETGP